MKKALNFLFLLAACIVIHVMQQGLKGCLNEFLKDDNEILPSLRAIN